MHAKAPRRHKAVALGRVAGGDVINLQRHNLSASLIFQNAQDRVQGPHPTQAARPPTHGLGPRKIANNPSQNISNDRRGIPARCFNHCKIKSAFGRVA